MTTLTTFATPALAALAAAIWLSACGSQSPTSPSPVGGETSSTHYAVSGVVWLVPARASAVLSRVEVAAGVNAGAFTLSTADGRYAMDQLLPGDMTLVASADGYDPATIQVTLVADLTADFGLQATPSADDTPPTEPPSAGLATLSGMVTDASEIGLVAVRLEIVSGPNVGRRTVTGPTGRYTISSLILGEATVEAVAPGVPAQQRRLSIVGDASADFRFSLVLFVTTGRTIDALTRAGLGGIAFVGPGVSGAPTDAAGAFLISTTDPSPTARRLAFTGANAVERHTDVRVPGGNALISMIAAGFDLAAFDEMFRAPVLTRWTTAPPLVIERRIIQFTDVNMPEGATLDDLMSPAEADSVRADLERALSPLTGGAFRSFSSVRIETSTVGSVVDLLNDGVIAVGWVAGLQAATGYVGYGRWSPNGDGTVTAGLVMLDSAFQRSGSPFLRAIRAHELGHALGYRHVTKTPSVMNAWAVLEPTAFDRDASRIAFDRQPGNRSPDIDPDAATVLRLNGTGRRWSAPLP